MPDKIKIHRMKNLTKNKIRFFNDAAGEEVLDPGQSLILLPEGFAQFERDYPGEIGKLSYSKQIEYKQEDYDLSVLDYLRKE